MPERFFQEGGVDVVFTETPDGLVSINLKSQEALSSLFYAIDGMGFDCDLCEESRVIAVFVDSPKGFHSLLNICRQNQETIRRVSISSRDRDPLRELLEAV